MLALVFALRIEPRMEKSVTVHLVLIKAELGCVETKFEVHRSILAHFLESRSVILVSFCNC